MAFVAQVLKSLMNKGLTRKQAKEVFNAHSIGEVSVHAASNGNSRHVVRKLRREGGERRPTYSNGWKVLCHKKGHRRGIPLSHPIAS